MKTYYIVEAVGRLNRKEFEAYVEWYITQKKLIGKLRNLLPQYTIDQNIKHHPLWIAIEAGISVEIIHNN